MIGRVVLLTAAGVMLAGCQTTGVGSVKGGECRIFERPAYAVKGRRAYDQDWIDSQIEGGVGGCGWKRPAARPASIDGERPRVEPAKPVQRRGLIRRIKDRVAPPAAAAPAPWPPVAAPVTAPVVTPSPPPRPRDPVDDLLNAKP